MENLALCISTHGKNADIANSRTKSSFKAQTCLYVARGTEFPVLLPTEAGDYTVFKNEATTTHLQPKVSAAIPNPATDETSFSYQLEATETATLSIYDQMGHKMEQTQLTGIGTYQCNTSHYPTGLYVYVVTINGNTILHDKLAIIK